MKVLLHSDMQQSIEKSGVGRAISHQKMALESEGIPYTTNPKEQHDIVHINTVFPQSYIKSLASKYRNKTVIFHAHSTEEDFRDSFKMANLLAPLFKRWIKRCYNSADLILTPSTYSKSLLDHYQLTPPIHVVSNGIDLNYWKATRDEIARFKARYQKDPNRKCIISVGLPIKRKGIIDFVELAKRMPEYDFIWFGYSDPKFLPKDVQRAYYTKLPNLTFAGYIERQDIRVAYSACDLYLFLTHEETEGIVLLEALASKANTIIRDIPVFHYPFKHQENIYKGSTVNEFEFLIKDILSEELDSLVDYGYHIAQKRSIDHVGKLLHENYQFAKELSRKNKITRTQENS